MKRVEAVLGHKKNDRDMDNKLFALYRDYRHDSIAVSILTNIANYRKELTGYRGIKNSPTTTNIIEGLNAHLEARLVPLRSFQSHTHAKLWLNAYVLKRRLTKWTDCRGKFKGINGKTGVQLTKKPGIDIPSLF